MSEPPLRQRPARERMLDAAHTLMRTVGLARVTTKEIARQAGCSEAALYKHFRGKEDLFLAVLRGRLDSRFLDTLDAWADTPGEGVVADRLTEVARQAVGFYEETFPIAMSLFTDPAFLARHRGALNTLEAGPHIPVERLEACLNAERSRGRLAPDADTGAAAALLLGACLHRVFVYGPVSGRTAPEPVGDFAASLARTVLRGVVAD